MSSVIRPLLGLYQHIIYIHFHSFSEQWPKHLGYQSLVSGPDILYPEWHYIVAEKPIGGGRVIKDVSLHQAGTWGSDGSWRMHLETITCRARPMGQQSDLSRVVGSYPWHTHR